MWFFVIFILLLVADLLDTTLLPLVFLLFLSIFLMQKSSWIFTLAFLSGLIIDTLLLRPLGQTSLFFVVFMLVALLYSRKFERQSSLFIFFATFLGEFFYLFLFGYNHVILQALVSSVAALLLFKILSAIVATGKAREH